MHCFAKGVTCWASRGDVRIVLGRKVLETFSPAKTTVPGLGYIKESFAEGSPELRAKSITVEKRDAGIAWGAVYAQYLSPISDVKQQGGEMGWRKVTLCRAYFDRWKERIATHHRFHATGGR